MTMLHFNEISEPRPTQAGLAEAYVTIDTAIDRGDHATAMADWDALRRHYDTWSALVHLRFAQDTTDAQAKADRVNAAAGPRDAPKLEPGLKRRLLADSNWQAVAALVGEHAPRLWETDVTTFDPVLKPDLEEEA